MVIGVGLDVIEIERIKKVFEKRSEKFIKKIFTQGELDYSFKFKEPYTHLGARFSAKEAFYKALSQGVIHFGEIEVYNLPNGKPEIRLHGKTRLLWEKAGSPKAHLSLSHNNSIASAVVVLEKE